MPREIPRRELSHPDILTKYPEVKTDVETKAKNSPRVQESHLAPSRSGAIPDNVVHRARAELESTRNELGKMDRLRKKIYADPKREWVERARAYSGDLGGLWHDLKAEIGDRVAGGVDPARDQLVNRALDLLEMAERQGELSAWLDTWADELQQPNQRLSWDVLGTILTNIQCGLQFATVMVDRALEVPSTGGTEAAQAAALTLREKVEPIRTELHLAIDALTAEITSQVNRVLNGEKVTLTSGPREPWYQDRRIGGSFSRLQDLSDRLGLAERLAKQGYKTFSTDFPDWKWKELPMYYRANWSIEKMDSALKAWADVAKDVGAATLSTIDSNLGVEEQILAAGDLDARAGDVAAAVLGVRSNAFIEESALMTTRVDHTRFLARNLADQVYKQQDAFARHMRSEASDVLRNGAGFKALDRARSMDLHEMSESSLYVAAVLKNNALNLWQDAKAEAPKYLNTVNNVPEPLLADWIAKEYEAGLEKALLAWNLRTVTPVATAANYYSKAWELVAMLRRHRARAEQKLAGHVEAIEYLRYALDALACRIASDIQKDISNPALTKFWQGA